MSYKLLKGQTNWIHVDLGVVKPGEVAALQRESARAPLFDQPDSEVSALRHHQAGPAPMCFQSAPRWQAVEERGRIERKSSENKRSVFFFFKPKRLERLPGIE